ncbi:MAG TPA: UDP-N-acetylmuramoyl-L-alanyl-D-glutamate--2,6-diaminopimelate ligase [Candidatus Eremiobacteraceae bacterium]
MASVMPVPLRQLLAGVGGALIGGNPDVSITSIAVDSRRVEPGALFVCLTGARDDGHRRAAQAVKAGAAAVLAEHPVELPSQTPLAVVADTLSALSPVSAEFFGHPSDALTMVGITGTNGKTTVAHFVEAIMDAADTPFGIIGTLGARFAGAFESKLANTTPFAHELQSLLAQMRDAGARGAVLEVSSHALSLHRVDDVDFDIAVLTNITQDHLDFHKTFDDYRAAKSRLFEAVTRGGRKSPGVRVLNLDDAEGRRLAITAGRTMTYAVASEDAVLQATDVSLDRDGATFLVRALRPAPFHIRLPGPFNVCNAMAAIAAACALDVDVEAIEEGLASVGEVPGRMTPVEARSIGVYVDYAHTPDGLRNVLGAARALTPGRVICVFGCGGDRDALKRPLMGRAARELSDYVIVTNDNPRREDPQIIIDGILAGMRNGAGAAYEVVPDRAAAIDLAVRSAEDGDVVIIAGKGHEAYQLIGEESLPFSDAVVARAAIEKHDK